MAASDVGSTRTRRASGRGTGPKPKGRVGIVLGLLVVLLAGGLAVWQARERDENSSAHNALLGDLTNVWQWSDAEYTGGAVHAVWSVRWDGEMKLAETDKLAGTLGLAAAPQGSGNGRTYRGELADPGGNAMKLVLWYNSSSLSEAEAANNSGSPSSAPPGLSKIADVGADAAQVQTIILLQPAAGTELAAIGDAVALIERAVGDASLSLAGSFAVRGIPAEGGASGRIAGKAEASRVEDYDDGNTVSITYYSPKLKTSVDSGARPVNLQIADVRAAAGEKPELVVGVPLITGDYTAQN